MTTNAEGPLCDTCDTKLGNVGAQKLSDGQERFLDAYRQKPQIARASRLARIHRATVYRWLQGEAFQLAVREAAECFFRSHRAKVLADEAAREEWRRQRELERQPMRREVLARARAPKQPSADGAS